MRATRSTSWSGKAEHAVCGHARRLPSGARRCTSPLGGCDCLRHLPVDRYPVPARVETALVTAAARHTRRANESQPRRDGTAAGSGGLQPHLVARHLRHQRTDARCLRGEGRRDGLAADRLAVRADRDDLSQTRLAYCPFMLPCSRARSMREPPSSRLACVMSIDRDMPVGRPFTTATSRCGNACAPSCARKVSSRIYAC